MTPLPKRKPSRQRQGKRRNTHHVMTQSLAECPQCKSLKRPYMVCAKCGCYDGKEVVSPKKIKAKNEKSA